MDRPAPDPAPRGPGKCEPTLRTFDLRGLPCGVWDFGAPYAGAPVALAVHGYLDTGGSFAAVSEHTHAHLLAANWRGHGPGPRLAGGTSFHQLDHLKDLGLLWTALSRVDLAPELLVGHSMGTSIALMFAAARPELVPRLLLLDGAGALPESPGGQIRRLGSLLRSEEAGPRPFRPFPSVEAARDRIRINNPGLSPRGADRMVRFSGETQADGTWSFYFDSRLRGPSPIRFSEEFWQQVCGQISCPTSALLGGKSPLTAHLPVIEERLSRIPNGTCQILPGAGHHIHLDHPDAVGQAMDRLLDPPLAPTGSQ